MPHFQILTILALSCGLAFVMGCTCPAMSFKELYYSGKTSSVIKAQVVAVSNPCLDNPGGACTSPADDGKVRYFKLKLIETYKGCGPMSEVFYAVSKVGGCGIFLQVNEVYLLNLPVPVVEKSEKTGYRELYKLCTCQQNIPWHHVTKEEQHFLSESMKEPVFKCDRAGV